MVFNIKKTEGFTLVELLVVISIIGILSSFAMVSLNGARMKARDALRKGDMAQMRTALTMYYDDHGGYPECDYANWDLLKTAEPDPMGSTAAAGTNCYNTVLTTALSSGSKPVMPNPPKEPKNKTNDPSVDAKFIYRYISDEGGQQYAIIYYLEDDPATPQIMRGY